MPVADLAAPDSALFLWATFPQLPEALRLIEAWGFTYKSVAFVWLKKNKKADSWFYGLGFWTRGNAEICLLATKGHPKRQAANIHQFIISPIEAHSKKPDEARAKIISLMGDLPRVELFARQTPPGWAVWGNEVTPTMQSCSSTMLMLGNAGAGALGASTYPCEDRDMLAAEAAYCALEDDLQHYLDTYESTHDYDEYHFDLDEIEHDPYVLLSLLCALHEGQWTIDEVQGTLQMLFDRQYILTEDVVVETRYRTETDTWTDEDGNSHTDTYQVPYDYYICTVTLENFDLSHVPVYVMGEEQLSRYAIYMATLGNRPDLFPDSPYVNKYITGKPGDYEVPGEYLDDETFAAMLAEAQKYIGYPYVWGGSSPATSFDCSGYVSWVINHSGWNVGRLGAQGLYNICTPTSSPKPGDLVFFKGTYDTPGVSHCGIYVGDGKMLHCGDPIGYANLNTSYWQSHFYAYGRLP